MGTKTYQVLLSTNLSTFLPLPLHFIAVTLPPLLPLALTLKEKKRYGRKAKNSRKEKALYRETFIILVRVTELRAKRRRDQEISSRHVLRRHILRGLFFAWGTIEVNTK